MALLPCICYYIEVPYELATYNGEQLYVSYTNCNGVPTSVNTGAVLSIDLGSSFAFYICSYQGNPPSFKYGFFGNDELISGINVTYTGNECFNDSDCYGPAPTPDPTSTPTQTPSNTPTQTPSNTPTRTPRPTPSITASPTVTPTQTGTPQPTPSPTAILCGEGFTDVNPGSTYFYTDCCGNFQQGSENKLPITLDYTKPSSGVIKMNVTASVSCPTPTPTVTQIGRAHV